MAPVGAEGVTVKRIILALAALALLVGCCTSPGYWGAGAYWMPQEYANLDWRHERPTKEGDWFLFVPLYAPLLRFHVDGNGEWSQYGEKFERPWRDNDFFYAPAPKEGP